MYMPRFYYHAMRISAAGITTDSTLDPMSAEANVRLSKWGSDNGINLYTTKT